MQKFFQAIAKPLIKLYQFSARRVQELSKIWAVMSGYVYSASDMLVKGSIDSYRKALKQVSAFRKKYKARFFYRILVGLLYALLIIVIFSYMAFYYLFVVPVGSSAVITRFGQYDREVQSGLNFIFPVIERYYIVNTGNLFEEPFGFRQGPLPITKERFNPQEKYITTQYESDLIRSESDALSPFSEKGHFLIEMNRKQRLTHDYLRRNVAPPLDRSSAGISGLINHKEAVFVDTKKANITLDGKIPVPLEMKLLTGDLGLIEMQWVVQYQIKNARQYLFNSRDVGENIRDIAMAKMNEVVGETSFMKVLTTGRNEIENKVQQRAQKMFDEYGIGIKITQIIILNTAPTRQVTFAFNEVNKAAQDLERFRFQGQIEYMQKIPIAYGQAAKIKAQGQAYAIKVVNQAQGESGRFTMIRSEYEKATQITKDRLYIVAMQEILRQTPNIILDKGAHGILPLFMNSRLLGNEGSAVKNSNGISQQLQQIEQQMMGYIKAQANQPAVPNVNPVAPGLTAKIMPSNANQQADINLQPQPIVP
jgi:membrane protease subunit HflK